MTQKEAIDILKLGVNVFLTGSAGSGKTFVLGNYITYCKNRNIGIGITASTGIAATHLGGMTINAWAGIGVKKVITQSDIDELLKRKYLHKRFSETKVLIIDEISMISPETLGHVDQVLRAFKRTDAPFGGVQVILCGDFFQLPPITKYFEDSVFLYQSPLWEELDLKTCYLSRPYRQTEITFQHMLSEIRSNTVTKFTWDLLRERFLDKLHPSVTATKLYTHTRKADSINDTHLAQLSARSRAYTMQLSGNEILSAMLMRNCLAPTHLILKKGAVVMFVKNNFEEGYVNGTLGTIVDFTEKEQFPVVRTYTGQEITAMPAQWEIEEESTVVARIRQIPLRLAWGITIHKSQGMSLDAAEIDLGKSFVQGMGYVALSRVRTLDGIHLKSINRTALSVNESVIAFDKLLQKESAMNAQELQNSFWYKVNRNREQLHFSEFHK
jgi:ATP-dependent DNA helicase PIF1